jgi:two-component system alkaline phosphatase synthesis response regulator PhoP
VNRVLVVEDNADLAAGLEHNLSLEGYDVRVAGEGTGAIASWGEWAPHLVILDLMLPGTVDGYGVLRAMRTRGDRTPVIILSALGSEADKVLGFRLDADQYVTKPFGVLELLERVRSLLRRSTREASAETAISFGDVRVDAAARTVHKAGEPVALSPKAFDLLLALVRRGGRVASRAELLREVWGYGGLVLSRTVDSHVAELRRRIEDDPAEPRHVITVWKSGYRFVP